MMSLQGAKQSLPRAKRGGGNLILRNGLLRCTLSVLLAMTVVFIPCQAAIKFDGVNDYIDMKTLPLSNTSNFTISTWVKLNSAPAPYATIISLEESIGFLRIDINSSRQANGYIFTGSQNYIGLTTLNLNQWYNLTYTRNGTDYRFFVDGVLQESRSLGNPVAGAGIEALGARNITGSNYNIDGSIDDTKIYNRPLSNGEILALYNSRSKRASGSLANGLIAHYEMDDDAIGEVTAQAKDSSGNLNHGQFVGFDNLVSNGFSVYTPVQIGTGYSLEFDGIDSYIQIAGPNSGPVNDIGTSDFTVSAWATNKATSNYQEIIGNWNTNGLFLGRDSAAGQLHAYVGDANAHVADINYTIPSDNSWHFYTLKRNSGTCEIFVDGILRGTNFSAPGTLATSVATRIGSRGNAVAEIWDGNLDDIRIYNRALIASEISFLYNGSGLDPGTSNLQALWTFDDDSALKDSSGNDNHGIGVGGDSLKYSEGVLKR